MAATDDAPIPNLPDDSPENLKRRARRLERRYLEATRRADLDELARLLADTHRRLADHWQGLADLGET